MNSSHNLELRRQTEDLGAGQGRAGRVGYLCRTQATEEPAVTLAAAAKFREYESTIQEDRRAAAIGPSPAGYRFSQGFLLRKDTM
ncbi:hypothetical protein RRG08_026357 [Elysia crispata]|uniref:Uncharacterized protein n=1 Tax=Elysia crispata TaxID=231223 RepID=A0AAE1CJ51_9GAST|nr:hypothetical protein RRG08_026357 [Elysia crispata]